MSGKCCFVGVVKRFVCFFLLNPSFDDKKDGFDAFLCSFRIDEVR